MRVGIIFVYVDYHRRGRKNRLSMQPQVGALIAGLLPDEAEIEIINETVEEPDWDRHYDLLFLSCMHSDFDRARQISHYWRKRGAKTVIGGAFASSYPGLCEPYFDAVVSGDPEHTVPQLWRDFRAGRLQARYEGTNYDASAVRTPRFDLMAGKGAHVFALEATRGCPFTCDFCVLTGLGTRHHVRPVTSVIEDIERGRALLRGRVPAHHLRVVGFTDNNLGGNLAYLRELCAALRPLRLNWYAAVTFNVIAPPDLVRLMAEAGARLLFVGLESFNPATLSGMNKHQNVAHKMRAAIDCCRDHGILVVSGLMVSPQHDGPDYIRRLPEHLDASGLRVPTFLCFETPIPGTVHFRQLATRREPAFQPDALLRDFSGYTLVTRPQQTDTTTFIDAYRDALRQVFARGRTFAKLAHDLPRLAWRGGWFPALMDAGDMLAIPDVNRPAAGRTYLAGTDLSPPEQVPLTERDFSTDAERGAILDPWHVTDGNGRVLPQWSDPRTVFAAAPPHRAAAPPREPAELPSPDLLPAAATS
jgi:radical SAM superfamily enzyme YgiQ (UPF0313 family)